MMDITSIAILVTMIIVIGVPSLANAYEAAQNKKRHYKNRAE